MMRSLLSGAAAGVLLVSAGCSTSSEPPPQIEIWEVLPGREMTEVLKKAEQLEHILRILPVDLQQMIDQVDQPVAEHLERLVPLPVPVSM